MQKATKYKIFALGFLIVIAFGFGWLRDARFFPAIAEEITGSDAIAVRVIPNPEHYSVSRWYSAQGFKGSPEALTIDGYEALRDGRTIYVNAANIQGNNLYTNIYLISYDQEAEEGTITVLDELVSHWKFNTDIADAVQKDRIIRDTKRLAGLADLETLLEKYKREKGYYPKLEAGSYIPNKTISVWPSWQKTLGGALASSLPLDPINKLGACSDPGFDALTCWNESAKQFASSLPTLPSGSNAFVYTTVSDGATYDICAGMESGYANLTAEACAGSGGSASTNQSPIVTCGNLVGTPGKEFKGYVSASDPENNLMTWTISTARTAWTGWSASPILRDTANAKQKEIYASVAGNKGNYNFDVIIHDGKGGVATKTCAISLSAGGPVVYPITDKEVVIGKTLNFVINASDPGSNYPLRFSFPGHEVTCAVENEKNCRVNQVIGNTFTATTPEGTDHNVGVFATNSLNQASAQQSFNLKVKNNKPVITKPLNCPATVRINNAYSCQLRATDPDGHTISAFTLTGAPAGLAISNSGLISGSPTVAGNYTVKVTARDEYNAVSSEESFALKVNTYCGDGARQEINSEGEDEECDGADLLGKNCLTAFTNQFTGGTLSCNSSCQLDSNSCVMAVFYSVSGRVDFYSGTGRSVPVEARDLTGNLIKYVYTDADGNYRLDNLPALADYDIVVAGEDAGTAQARILSLSKDEIKDFSLYDSTSGRSRRIVLTWTTLDMDSHLLITPPPPLSGTDVYFNNKSSGFVSLDRDDTNSGLNDTNGHEIGQENIGISAYVNGYTYSYYVWDSSGSGHFNESVVVRIYDSNGLKLKEYKANAAKAASHRRWDVFTMNDSGVVTDVNTYSDNFPGS